MKLKIHPIAETVPKMSAEAFAMLKEDIQRNGLAEPIWIKGGLIVDGRHRFRACRELGIKPATREFIGEDVESFIISTNVARRHLTNQQRRYFVKRLAELHPEKTDRAIAAATGASAPTVAAVRRELPPVKLLQERRVGLDGKNYPAPVRAPSVNHSVASLISRKDFEFKRFIKWLSDLHPSEITDPDSALRQLSEQLERMSALKKTAASI